MTKLCILFSHDEQFLLNFLVKNKQQQNPMAYILNKAGKTKNNKQTHTQTKHKQSPKLNVNVKTKLKFTS
jgi:hypothetical protein